MDCHSLGAFIRGHSNKRQRTDDIQLDRRPIAIVRFNAKVGKPKPVTLRALLDSGAGGTLISEEFTKKLKLRKLHAEKQVWTTPGGNMTTDRKVKAQFTMPELNDKNVIQWDMHVTKTMGAYDMIIGRDLLEFLGIDVRFSNLTIEWGTSSIPFKDHDASVKDSYHVDDPTEIQGMTTRVKEILDAKYTAADLETIARSQDSLDKGQQQKLLDLMYKYESLFDGTLGTWNGTKAKLDLIDGATPYHARAYPVPRCHLNTLKVEVERLCHLGVLKKVNRSEWGAPTFIIPKKDGTVRFISDFRELNKRIK